MLKTVAPEASYEEISGRIWRILKETFALAWIWDPCGGGGGDRGSEVGRPIATDREGSQRILAESWLPPGLSIVKK